MTEEEEDDGDELPVGAAVPERLMKVREPADPATFLVAVEAGSLYCNDPAWDLFAERDSLPSYGGRIGYRVRERILLVGGWQARRSRVAGADTLVVAPEEGSG